MSGDCCQLNRQQSQIPLTFFPTNFGYNEGNLAVNTLTNGVAGVLNIGLDGQGLTSTPNFTVSPASVSFTPQTIGGSSVSQLVTITNTSGGPVSLISFNVPAEPFQVTDPPGTGTLAAGASVSFHVTFNPPGTSGNFPHLFGGLITLTTSAGDVGVPLSGSAATPPNLSLSTTVLHLAKVAVGRTSTASITLQNASGLNTASAKVVPPTSPFTLHTPLRVGQTILGNSRQTVTVRFQTTKVGHATSTFALQATGEGAELVVEITGTGLPAKKDKF
jgi:hypothetical protein